MKTFQFLNRMYILFFYKLVRFVYRLDQQFLENPDMEWIINKALIALSFIQMIWFFTLLKVIEIIIGKEIPYFFDDQLMDATLLVVLISIFNYFTLIYKKRWYKYDQEFAEYSKIRNRIINIAIPVFYIISFALFVVVFIIWGNLWDAGKIDGF